MLWHKYRELGQILAQAIVLFSLSIFKNALMLAHTLIMREVYNKYVPLRDIAASVSLRSPNLSLYSASHTIYNYFLTLVKDSLLS
jgi:hypothetical protein